jgi:gamma-glutamylputrescine oxidase
VSLDHYAGRHIDSYYAATAHPHPRYPALKGTEAVDVCVVGAGLTGISAALELAGKGYSVALLEAGQVAWAASGRSGGQAIHGFAAGMDMIAAQLGKADARKLWDISIEGIDLIRQRIRDFKIDCDWQDGWVWAAVKDRQIAYLEDSARQMRQDYGYDTTVLQGAAMRACIDSPRYKALLVDPRGGHLHPLNYSLALADAAAARGVQIYEASRATRIEYPTMASGSPIVHTEHGNVRCSHVILAGNCYLGDTARSISARIMPVGTYIIATEPLDPALMKQLLPQRHAICDANFVLDYFRPSADHRMLFGGRVSYTTRTPSNLAESMRQRMLKVFPQLASARVSHCWGGFVDITMNRAPDFGRISRNVYYAQGFSGHGIALTGIAGKLMAEAVAGSAERFDLFAKIRHRDFPGGQLFRAPALVLATAWYRLRDFL